MEIIYETDDRPIAGATFSCWVTGHTVRVEKYNHSIKFSNQDGYSYFSIPYAEVDDLVKVLTNMKQYKGEE